MEFAAESSPEPDLLSCSLQDAVEQMELINRQLPEILMKIEKQKLEIASKNSALFFLESHNGSLRCTAAWRRKTMDPLYLTLDKLSFANNAYKDNAIKHSFLEEEETDYRRMNFKIMHGRRSLQKERRVPREIKTKEGKDSNTTGSGSSLKDIHAKIRGMLYMPSYRTDMVTVKDREGGELGQQLKQLEVEREKVIANCAVGGKIWSSLGSRKTIKEQIDAEQKEAEESREERWRVQLKIKRVKESLKCLQEEHSSVNSQLNDLCRRKQQVREQIIDLKKQLGIRPTKKKKKEKPAR